jgi:hypothetical protein
MDAEFIIKAFNQINLEMIEYFAEQMPNNIEMATLKTAVVTLINSTPEINILTFKECTVKPYREQIESRNIDFFINGEYTNNVMDIGISKLVFNILNQLRDDMSLMDPDVHDKMMDFLNKMIKISDMYGN